MTNEQNLPTQAVEPSSLKPGYLDEGQPIHVDSGADQRARGTLFRKSEEGVQADLELQQKFEETIITWSPGQRAKVRYVPKVRLRLYQRAIMGKATPRQAIKAMCQHCIGYQDVSHEIGNCTARGCPLWSLRPYQKKEGAKA